MVAWGDNTRYQCNVPALAPGETFTHIEAGRDFTVALYDTGGFNRFGTGCSGRLGVTELVATPRPRIGTTFTTELRPPPPPLAYVLTGFSNTSCTLPDRVELVGAVLSDAVTVVLGH